MASVIGRTFAEAYNELLVQLRDAPEASPRGMATREMIGTQLVVEDPRARLAYAAGRRMSLAFALAEFTWIMQGRDDLAFVEHYNARYRQFSDDGETLYGAYGRRLRGGDGEVASASVPAQLRRAVDKLARDADSRQAVAVIYWPSDVTASSKDIPCSLTWQFLARGGRLNMIVTMRSNDAFWGLPYDLFVNTMVLEYVAHALGVDVGTYVHQVGSMHAYERHWPWFDLKFEPVVMPSQATAMFPHYLARAERFAREHACAQPQNSDHELVSDCGLVFARFNAWLENQRMPASQPREWAARFVRDWESKSVTRRWA